MTVIMSENKRTKKNEDVSYVYISILVPICSLRYLNAHQQ